MMCARGAYLSARAFLDRIHGERVEMLGGLEMGAVPLIAAGGGAEQRAGRAGGDVLRPQAGQGARHARPHRGPGARRELAGKAVMVADDVAPRRLDHPGGGRDPRRRAVVETALVLVTARKARRRGWPNMGATVAVFGEPVSVEASRSLEARLQP